jgi:DNA-binding GntR family transcriptional regulator
MTSRKAEGASPTYQRVADELIERIGAGTYPVGTNLPTEMELSRQFGISRHTVREALRQLHHAGLVSRRKRVGTEVVARRPRATYLQPTNTIADFLQYADETQLSILQTRRVVCDGALAEVLECEEGDEWLRVTSLRAVPGDTRPLCMTIAHVPGHLPNIGKQLEGLTGPISAMLERVYGVRISRIEQSIQAVRLVKRAARLLRATEGSPALRAIRRYYDDRDTLIELSSAIHPGERFTYVTSLERGAPSPRR